MGRTLSRGVVIGLVLSGAAVAQVASQTQSGESLGDLARAYQAKQQAQQAGGKMPRVITNQDLPAGSTPAPESTGTDTMTQVSGVVRTDNYADLRLSNRLSAEQRAGVEWKARIQEQEGRISDLQMRIDRVNAAIHAAVGTAQYETPVNRYQAAQMGRLATMEEALDLQKQKLAAMQDAARRAGAYQ